MSFSPANVAQGCREQGAILQFYLPEWCDGTKLLWALAGNESSFGWNIKPRTEPAFEPGGRYFDKEMEQLWAQFGREAAASHGIFQIMLINAPGFTPIEFRDNLTANFSAVIGYIRRRIFPEGQPQKWPKAYSEFADAYNSGNFRDKNVPLRYIADFYSHLKHPMPLAESAASV